MLHGPTRLSTQLKDLQPTENHSEWKTTAQEGQHRQSATNLPMILPKSSAEGPASARLPRTIPKENGVRRLERSAASPINNPARTENDSSSIAVRTIKTPNVESSNGNDINVAHSSPSSRQTPRRYLIDVNHYERYARRGISYTSAMEARVMRSQDNSKGPMAPRKKMTTTIYPSYARNKNRNVMNPRYNCRSLMSNENLNVTGESTGMNKMTHLNRASQEQPRVINQSDDTGLIKLTIECKNDAEKLDNNGNNKELPNITSIASGKQEKWYPIQKLHDRLWRSNVVMNIFNIMSVCILINWSKCVRVCDSIFMSTIFRLCMIFARTGRWGDISRWK